MYNNLLPLLVILVIVGVSLIIGRRISAASKKKSAEYSRRFNERLLNPDLAALEAHYGTPAPQALRALYADQAELKRGDFEVAASATADEEDRHFIAFYQPADAEGLDSPWPGTETYFAFANDGAGNEYLIDPRLSDPPVLFHDHETGEFSPVCSTLSEFMTWPRLEPTED